VNSNTSLIFKENNKRTKKIHHQKPLEGGAFEELGGSTSTADGSVLLAKSMGKGLCLGQL
jgi:hypothetical protein